MTFVSSSTLLKQKMGWMSGQNGLIQTLRSHFFLKNIGKKVAEYESSCCYCQIFTNKVNRHLLTYLGRNVHRFLWTINHQESYCGKLVTSTSARSVRLMKNSIPKSRVT